MNEPEIERLRDEVVTLRAELTRLIRPLADDVKQLEGWRIGVHHRLDRLERQIDNLLTELLRSRLVDKARAHDREPEAQSGPVPPPTDQQKPGKA
jgi:hypothetical protein